MNTVEVDGRSVAVTNEDKVFFADSGITKGDVVDYHRRVAEWMLPFLRGRPLVMRRFPDGIDADGFFQKNTPDHFPDWIDTAPVTRRDGGTVRHVVANDTATLVHLADQGMIEAHTLLTPADSPDRPDQLVVDLDPSTDDVGDVVDAARLVLGLLDDIDVVGFVKATGSRGLHVHVGLDGTSSTAECRSLTRRLADTAVGRDPDLLTVERSIDARGDRVLVDWWRNGHGQHAVAPFSLRALPGAPVAIPLDRDEATSRSFDPRRITLRNVFRRLAHKDDPWEQLDAHRYSPSALTERLARLPA